MDDRILAVTEFSWDEQKQRINLEKHRIDFLDAIEIFAVDHIDVPSAYEMEERRKITGRVGGKLYTVIYTFRNQSIRIISARRARRDEERAYRSVYDR